MRKAKDTKNLSSMKSQLRQTFGAAAVQTVKITMEHEASVAELIRAMDAGKNRVARCKASFGD